MPIDYSEGTQAPSYAASRKMFEAAQKAGVDMRYREFDASHGGMIPLALPGVFKFFDSVRKKQLERRSHDASIPCNRSPVVVPCRHCCCADTRAATSASRADAQCGGRSGAAHRRLAQPHGHARGRHGIPDRRSSQLERRGVVQSGLRLPQCALLRAESPAAGSRLCTRGRHAHGERLARFAERWTISRK